MKIDFLAEECSEKRSELTFGLCDGPDLVKAYVTVDPAENWIAIVHNPKGSEVTFHAVDDCIEILRPDGTKDTRCDCILTYPQNLVFVELKEVAAQWITDGIEQMQEAIEVFGNHHNLFSFRKRRAFLANRKHPKFQYSHKEQMEKFKVETSVRLIIHNRINI